MENLIKEIKKENFDIDFYVKEIQENFDIRNEVISNLLYNKDTMVYYHCYYILDKATKENPVLFYKYWNDFYSLLSYKNYYYRDIGLTLLANLSKIDKENLFDRIKNEYFSHLNEANFEMANNCVKNINIVCKNKSKYLQEVVEIYLNIEKIVDFPEKQRELIKFEIIKFFDMNYENIEKKEKVIEFIQKATSSISPKTRRRAKASRLKKYFKY
ncbi:hypothetical protein [Miniphocaeibacter massiliensis]|uniref:hypothetical protein n=1 Tax=Miniphocaeibacter massiliensis TaxID=2041841 RepID=UPI000C06FDEB|nr:hypothetical protein [Miniphocaeibacter massiliensis]